MSVHRWSLLFVCASALALAACGGSESTAPTKKKDEPAAKKKTGDNASTTDKKAPDAPKTKAASNTPAGAAKTPSTPAKKTTAKPTATPKKVTAPAKKTAPTAPAKKATAAPVKKTAPTAPAKKATAAPVKKTAPTAPAKKAAAAPVKKVHGGTTPPAKKAIGGTAPSTRPVKAAAPTKKARLPIPKMSDLKGPKSEEGVLISNPAKGTMQRVLWLAMQAAMNKDEFKGWTAFKALLHSSQSFKRTLDGWRQFPFNRFRRQVQLYQATLGKPDYRINRIEVQSPTRIKVFVHNKRSIPTPCYLSRDPKAGNAWRIDNCSL